VIWRCRAGLRPSRGRCARLHRGFGIWVHLRDASLSRSNQLHADLTIRTDEALFTQHLNAIAAQGHIPTDADLQAAWGETNVPRQASPSSSEQGVIARGVELLAPITRGPDSLAFTIKVMAIYQEGDLLPFPANREEDRCLHLDYSGLTAKQRSVTPLATCPQRAALAELSPSISPTP